MKVFRSLKKKNWKRQNQRKEEAKIRQANYETLTVRQRIEKLGKYRAEKQRTKLQYQLKEQTMVPHGKR